MHVADSNRSFPGYGHMDLDSILKAVKGTGYEDYISFECFNRPSVETVLQQTGPWVDHIRGLCPHLRTDQNACGSAAAGTIMNRNKEI